MNEIKKKRKRKRKNEWNEKKMNEIKKKEKEKEKMNEMKKKWIKNKLKFRSRLYKLKVWDLIKFWSSLINQTNSLIEESISLGN